MFLDLVESQGGITKNRSAANMRLLGTCNGMNTTMNNNMRNRDPVPFSSPSYEGTVSPSQIAEVKSMSKDRVRGKDKVSLYVVGLNPEATVCSPCYLTFSKVGVAWG